MHSNPRAQNICIHTAYIQRHSPLLKNFLAESEAELVTLDSEYASQLRGAAVEHRHLALLLRDQLLEHFVPVRTARVSPGLQSRDEVPLLL